MKKLILALFLLGSFQFATAQSQEILTLVENSFGKAVKENLSEPREQIKSILPEDKQEDFLKEFDGAIFILYKKVAQVLLKNFSEEEVKAILNAKQDPDNNLLTGDLLKKYSDKEVAVGEEISATTDEWAMMIEGILMKYIPEEE
mgnify:FL=1